MNLNFTINNQIIKRTDKNSVVNLSDNYLILNFDFSDDWNELTKFAIFKQDDKSIRLAIVDDAITLPDALLNGDRLIFSVYGIDGEDYRITTNQVKIYLLESGFTKETSDIEEIEYDVDFIEEIYLALDKKVPNTTFDGALEDITTQLNEIETTLSDKVDKETGKGLSSNNFTNQYKSLIDNSQILRITAVNQTSTREQFTATINQLTVSHGTIIGLLNSKGYNNDDATLMVNDLEKPIYVGNAPIRMYEWAFGRIGLFVYVTWTSINQGNGAWVLLNPYNIG